ncbi:MAG TPA: PQQ-binding-like beta-propeller repeat protein [Bacteroidales bacterium]|nr:PQQ-binding-like beta-propeller repeat protein [Bacteroidales bacterium]
MKRSTLLIGITAAAFTVLFSWWIIAAPSYPAVNRVPGMDNRPPAKPASDSVIIGQNFDSLGQIDKILPGSWPHFRGAAFDNINSDPAPLAEKWDTAGPPVVWRTSLGEGYSGPAVLNGRVYVLDYNEKRKADMLRCFSLYSGKELWRRWYRVDMKRNHGYSRTIPSVTDKYVVTIGPRSHVMCVDAITGKLLWKHDLEKEYGIPGSIKGRITPDFFTGQCPLIDNDMAIIAPGGKALMIAISCRTGKVLWQTPNPDSLRMSHTSIMPMTIFGKRMYVYNAVGGVCGISAETSDAGKLLWKTLDWSPATVAASPLYLGGNEIAVFGSYGAGGAKIKLNQTATGIEATVTDIHKATDGLASDQQTPILKDGYIWSVMPETAGALKKQLVCYPASDILHPVWTSGKNSRFGRGLGPYIMSGDKLYLLDDDGKIYLFRLDGKSAELISGKAILNGIEAWGPMAIAGRYLIMRDSRNLLCLDIGAKTE